jgi:hypothetical protein
MELTPQEIRVLGCLAEKEATTPDAYPLSTNGLLLACNQRSSRHPVVQYDEDEVTRALVSLRERDLVRTAREGGRVYRHAHRLRQQLDVDDAELAVLSVLFLRGPQTPGELRSRTERQHAFATVAAVEAVLERLARRDPAFVLQLPRGAGRKESRWAQILGGGEPASPPHPPRSISPTHPGEVEAPPAAATTEQRGSSEEIDALRTEIAALRAELAELRARVDGLEARR